MFIANKKCYSSKESTSSLGNIYSRKEMQASTRHVHENRREKRGQIVKNNKGTAPYQKREINSESVQAQMPLLKNTLLVSQTA